MLTEMLNFVFKCTDFCRVHGNLLQNQVHKNFCPMKMQVYTFPYPHSTIRRGVEGSSQAIRSGNDS